jgi:hypothetical protein
MVKNAVPDGTLAKALTFLVQGGVMGSDRFQAQHQTAYLAYLEDARAQLSELGIDVDNVIKDERHGRTYAQESTDQRLAAQRWRELRSRADAAISAKHQQVGGGPAQGDVVPEDDGVGFYRLYGAGAIYWREDLGAAALYGVLYTRYAQIGGSSSFLGYPTSDHKVEPDGVGFSASFEHGNLYSLSGHTFEVHGAILSEWLLKQGGTQGWLGYPTSNEYGESGGVRRNDFDNGRVRYDPAALVQVATEPHWITYAWDPIVFGTGTPVGGRARLTLYANGQTNFSGHLHDSGAPSYTTFTSMVAVDAAQAHALVFYHQGHTDGSFSSTQEPNDDWDDWRLIPDVVTLWSELKAGSWRSHSKVDGYLVFTKLIELFSDLWDAVFKDTQSEAPPEDPALADPYPSEDLDEEGLPPAALRMN